MGRRAAVERGNLDNRRTAKNVPSCVMIGGKLMQRSPRDDRAPLAHHATRAAPNFPLRTREPIISSSGGVERRRVCGERTRARTTEPPRPEPQTAPESFPSEAQRRMCTREASRCQRATAALAFASAHERRSQPPLTAEILPLLSKGLVTTCLGVWLFQVGSAQFRGEMKFRHGTRELRHGMQKHFRNRVLNGWFGRFLTVHALDQDIL